MISVSLCCWSLTYAALLAHKSQQRRDVFGEYLQGRKKEYAAALIEDLIKMDAVESVQGESIELSLAQKQALDKELEAIKNNPSYLQKWDDVKGQFKKG